MPWSSGDSLNSTNLNNTSGLAHNVKQYGAIGDGRDDAAAFTSAIAAAAEATAGQDGVSGLVVVPQGTYRLSSTVTQSNRVIVQGVGRGTVISASSVFPAGTYLWRLGTTAGNNSHGIMLRDLVIDGNSKADICVYSDNVQENSGLQNVTVKSYLSEGIFYTGSKAANYTLENLQVFPASSASSTIGIHLATTANRGSLRAITVGGASGQTQLYCLEISGGNVIINGCHCEGAPVGLHFSGSGNGVVIGLDGHTSISTLLQLAGTGAVIALGLNRDGAASAVIDGTNEITTLSNYMSAAARSSFVSEVEAFSASGAARITSRASAGQAQIYVLSPTAQFGYIRIQSGNTQYDIATQDNVNSGALQFRPLGSATNATLFGTNGIWYMDNPISMTSATALPSTLSGRGYFYTDSASSVYWINGSGVSKLVA